MTTDRLYGPDLAGQGSGPAGRLPRLTGSEWCCCWCWPRCNSRTSSISSSSCRWGRSSRTTCKSVPRDFPDKFSSIVSAYGFSAGIMGLLAARLLDRFDRKKSLLVLFSGFAVGTFLCAVAPNYTVLLVGRAVAGGFAGVMGANVLTIVSDVFPESRRATAMGVVMSSFSVASIVGIYVGLGDRRALRLAGPVHRPGTPLPAGAGAGVVRPAAPAPPPGAAPARGVSLREVILNPRHLRAYALTSSLIMGSWMVIPPLAIYLVKNLHWPEADLRWVWLVGGVATLLTMTPTGWLADSRDKLTVFRVIGLLSVIPVLLVTNLPETSMPVTPGGDDAVHGVHLDSLGAGDGDDYDERRAPPPRHLHERQRLGAAAGDGPGVEDFRPVAGREDGRGQTTAAWRRSWWATHWSACWRPAP